MAYSLFSDGAVEIHNAKDEMLGRRGTDPHSSGTGYPGPSGFEIGAVEEQRPATSANTSG